MRIVHNISKRVDEADRELLKLLAMKADDSEFVTIRIDEADPRWPEVARWVAEQSPVDIYWTEFTNEEVAAARWVRLFTDWMHGYPQPEDDYAELTYGATGCGKCAVGRVQRAPFRLKGEPRWGRRGIFQLFWVYSEFFVRPEVWKEVFRPLGVEARPVLNRKGTQELRTVVQLVANEQVSVATADLLHAICPVCGERKYLPHRRGPLPSLLAEPGSHYVKTTQWFGDGGEAFQETVISNALMRALVAHGARGAKGWPVADADMKRVDPTVKAFGGT